MKVEQIEQLEKDPARLHGTKLVILGTGCLALVISMIGCGVW